MKRQERVHQDVSKSDMWDSRTSRIRQKDPGFGSHPQITNATYGTHVDALKHHIRKNSDESTVSAGWGNTNPYSSRSINRPGDDGSGHNMWVNPS